MNLLTKSNTKIRKGETRGYRTLGLHLAPAKLSGWNTCASASCGCAASCLNTAGRGQFNSVQQSRIQKTIRFFHERDSFLGELADEIDRNIKSARRAEQTPCFRLNLTSDIMWENYGILDMFQDVQFYDYTKHRKRMLRYLAGELPKNYHLTFSRSESNQKDVEDVISEGGNVAAVFSGKQLPQSWMDRPVIDGDSDDLRFLDPTGVIVGLLAKGKAKNDKSGFVIR